MLEVELGLLSDDGVRVECGLNPVPQAGNVHGLVGGLVVVFVRSALVF